MIESDQIFSENIYISKAKSKELNYYKAAHNSNIKAFLTNRIHHFIDEISDASSRDE